MTYLAFLAEIADAPLTYVFMLLVTICIYYLVLRKRVYSIFDPLFIIAIFAILAAADVFFLAWRDLIESRYLIQFAATETAFLAGLCFFRPFPACGKVLRDPDLKNDSRFLSALYVLSSGIFVVTQLGTYAAHGIPLFYASRLQYYGEGGGLGALSRVLDITWFFSCYLLIYRFCYKVKIQGWPILVDVFVALALLMAPLLSGSKSGLMLVIYCLFYFRFLHRGALSKTGADLVLTKVLKYGCIGAAVAAVLVVAVQLASAGPVAWAYSLYQRIVSSGDTFFMAYPNRIIDSLPNKNGILAIFESIAIMFRLVSPDNVPENLGYRLFRAVYGGGDFVGPNPRHNIFGVVYFGLVGGIVYSLLLGLILGYIRNRLAGKIRLGGALEPLYVFVAISAVGIATDVGMLMKDLGSVLLVVPALYAMAAIISVASARRRAPAQHFRAQPTASLD